MPDTPPHLLVLLLPERLEDFAHRPLAEDLLAAGGVVAVDPPRTSYGSLARIPDALGVSIASKQARRLRRRLPGEPAAIAIFDPGQYPLARAILSQLRGCELWYGHLQEVGEDRGRRLHDLHLMATERATVVFGPHDGDVLHGRLSVLGTAA